MSSSILIQQILDIHNQMKNLIVDELKIMKIERYNTVIVDLEEYSETELKELLVWLNNIKNNQYKQLRYVWNLLPKSMWEGYDLYKITGLREQGMLQEAKDAIKLLWLNPYRTAKQMERKAARKNPNKHKSV